MNHATVIRLHQVHKSFGNKKVLDGASFEVLSGETVAILGASGSGKSVTLKHVNGLIRPDEGRVEALGHPVSEMPERDLVPVRRRISYLFQGGALFDSMTVRENVAFPLREHLDLDEDALGERVERLLEMVELPGIGALMPAELSGGMKKRVALARALALDPEIILYDEPTTGLDPIIPGVIDKLVNDFKRGMGITSVVVTHDMGSAFRVADRMVMLYEGRVVASGTPAEFREMASPLVDQFVNGRPDGPIPLRLSKISYEADILTERVRG